jgi:hypothetical protein
MLRPQATITFSFIQGKHTLIRAPIPIEIIKNKKKVIKENDRY